MKSPRAFATEPGRPADPASRRPTAPALLTAQRWLRTPKAALVGVLLLLAAVTAPGAPGGPVRAWLVVTVAAATAAATDVVLAAVRRWGLIWPDGALLTGMIIAMVVDPTVPPVRVAAVAAGSIVTKHLLRVRRRHLFNPAAFALVAAAPLGVTAQSWWGAASAPQPIILPLLLVSGCYTAGRVNRLPMVGAFLGGYWTLLVTIGFLGLTSHIADAFHAPLVNAVMFFALVMVDDPPTSPGRLVDQYTYGLVVAATSVALFLSTLHLVFLPAALLAGNAWLALRRYQQHIRPPAPARPADPARLSRYGAMAAALLVLLVLLRNTATSDTIPTPRSTPDQAHTTSASPGAVTPPVTTPTALATTPTAPSGNATASRSSTTRSAP